MQEPFDLTVRSDNDFYDLLESRNFKDYPSDEIFRFLSTKVKLVPFCTFLKRLIYKKAGFERSVAEIETEEFRKFIVDSFKKNGVPASFTSKTTKVSAAAKNWLEAAVVSRESVFLLGFGLNLSSAEVSDLLSKGLHEGTIYYRNSFEAICSYCLDNNLPFSKMQQLCETYKNDVVKMAFEQAQTVQIGSLIKRAVKDEELLQIIEKYKLNPVDLNSRTARDEFDRLYAECSEIISYRKRFEDDEWDLTAISEKRRLSDAIRKKLQEKPTVSASDIEKALNTGTPVDENGNLVRFSNSKLCEVFRQKRMTRSHISDIQMGKEAVSRFDLITMEFFVSSYTLAEQPNNVRWYSFVEKCNALLTKCSMGQLYNANPYDVFLQMCMLTDVPMATYDDILEMSYAQG